MTAPPPPRRLSLPARLASRSAGAIAFVALVVMVITLPSQGSTIGRMRHALVNSADVNRATKSPTDHFILKAEQWKLAPKPLTVREANLTALGGSNIVGADVVLDTSARGFFYPTRVVTTHAVTFRSTYPDADLPRTFVRTPELDADLRAQLARRYAAEGRPHAELLKQPDGRTVTGIVWHALALNALAVAALSVLAAALFAARTKRRPDNAL